VLDAVEHGSELLAAVAVAVVGEDLGDGDPVFGEPRAGTLPDAVQVSWLSAVRISL
jgi:hypothetical protein